MLPLTTAQKADGLKVRGNFSHYYITVFYPYPLTTAQNADRLSIATLSKQLLVDKSLLITCSGTTASQSQRSCLYISTGILLARIA